MKKTILLLCVVMASIMANAASLPTIYVNADPLIGNDVTGTGEVATPVKTLAKALTLLGGQTTEIILAAGTYNETTIGNISVACPNLVIKGANAATTIINGSGITNANGRILKTASNYESTSNNLTLQDLTFTRAGYQTGVNHDAGGGAIYFRQTGTTAVNNLTLNRVIFDDNKAGYASSSLPRNGGALYFNGINLTINDCYFKNNKASVGTGTSLNTSSGGAIFIIPQTAREGAFVTITNTTFDGNEAGKFGGAIDVSCFTYGSGMVKSALVTPSAGAPNSYLKFTNCTFINNKVRKNPVLGTDADAVTGTAIHASTETGTSFIYDFTVANCTFANNIGGSTNAAGGVATAPFESKSTVDFDGTNWATATFVNNIINVTATANCGSALMVNTATGGTKFFGSNNIIESVHANITDASFYTAGANATEMNSVLTNNSTGTVFAVPYLTFNYASNAKDAGIATFGDPNIVPAGDVRGELAYVYPKKDLGAYEYDLLATGATATKLADRTNIARTTTGISATFDGAAVVELYTVNGRLIEKTNAVGSYNHKLNNGLYIVRINGKATKFLK